MGNLDEIREEILSRENNLSKYACKSIEGVRRKPDNKDIRPIFSRDVDKIIHSFTYTRYMDKTQVFSFNENDHISKRMIHVQLKS